MTITESGYETSHRQEVISLCSNLIYLEVIAMRITECGNESHYRHEVISQCSNIIYTWK